MKVDLESITDGGDPYEMFVSSIRDAETRRKYKSYLRQFLAEVPDNVYGTVSGTADKSVEGQARLFVRIAERNPKLASGVIVEYIKLHKGRVESGDMNPNTLPNLIKPIRALLDSNGVALHWKSIRKMYPRPTRTEDRGYTKNEIQRMMENGHDLTDKVILTVFSSAGFRVEAWEYLCWKDVKFFKNDDGTFRGAALLIYRGDPERYYTFITPEACQYLDMYRERWKNDIGRYPAPDDPLLRVTTQITVKQLNSKGVKSRITNLAREAGLRPKLPDGKRRHTVPLDHGFRKYFNTMMRRAKVNYLDKEDMMGHTTGLEKHYERYNEEDFERFPEYQKAIPFLTISDEERIRAENQRLEMEKSSADHRTSLENQALLKEIREMKEDLAKVKKRQEVAERYEKK